MAATHYDVLGVSASAPVSVIKAAFRARIRETHPDAGGNAAEAQAVNDAWTVLQDEKARAAYDRTLTEKQPAPAERTRTEPARSATTSAKPKNATPVYSTFGPPQQWWKTKLTWIPVAVAVVAAGAAIQNFPLAAAGAVVGVGVSLLRWDKALIVSVLASVAPSVLYWLSGEVTQPVEAILVTLPALAAVTAIALTRVAQSRQWKLTERHIGDIVLTTAASNGLPVSTVEDVGETTGGMRLISYNDGSDAWPLPTARSHGGARAGDRVVVQNGNVVAWAGAAAVIAAEKALAQQQNITP